MMQVIIAGGGGAAHLPGMVAAFTPLPVIDFLYVLLHWMALTPFSLLCSKETKNMPRGVPVATVAINNATNAGLLTVRMLGVADTSLQASNGNVCHITSLMMKKIVVVVIRGLRKGKIVITTPEMVWVCSGV
ncbi:phosphoribosylaminoimidazole carboxylase, chloroplastic-like protein [Tanacetum coccineum]